MGLEQRTINSNNSSWVLMIVWAQGRGAGGRRENVRSGFQISALIFGEKCDCVQDGDLGAEAGLDQAV